MAKLQKVVSLSGHEDQVWCVSWSPDGKLLASCGTDKVVRIWGKEGENWVMKSRLDGAHSRTIRCVSWSPCCNLLASTSFDATTCIWDRREGEFECTATLEGHENEVKCATWSRSGALLATCSRDKSVWIWEVEEDGEYECASVLTSHTQDVKVVRWHPSRDLLVSAGYDNTIRLYSEEGDDWENIQTLESHESTVWGVAFDARGDRLVSVSADHTLKIWKEYKPGNPLGIQTRGKHSTWKCVYTLSGAHERPIYDVSWCPLTGRLVTGCGDDHVRVYEEDLTRDEHEPSLTQTVTSAAAHDGDVNSVSWNPRQPGLLASAGDDGLVTLWQYCDADT